MNRYYNPYTEPKAHTDKMELAPKVKNYKKNYFEVNCSQGSLYVYLPSCDVIPNEGNEHLWWVSGTRDRHVVYVSAVCLMNILYQIQRVTL